MTRPPQDLLNVLLGARAQRVERPVAIARSADLDEQEVERRARIEGAAVAAVGAELHHRRPWEERRLTGHRGLQRHPVRRGEANVLADLGSLRRGGRGERRPRHSRHDDPPQQYHGASPGSLETLRSFSGRRVRCAGLMFRE